jgi:hypothetical protein
MLASVSYAEPLMNMIALRYGKSFIAQGLKEFFKRLVAWRAALMLGGIGFSIAAVGVQAVAWYFDDNLLETWCDESAFGKGRKNKSFSNADIQMRWYGDAIQEVL